MYANDRPTDRTLHNPLQPSTTLHNPPQRLAAIFSLPSQICKTFEPSVSFTLSTLNKAKRVVVLVTGDECAPAALRVLTRGTPAEAFVFPAYGLTHAVWLLDKAAALPKLLSRAAAGCIKPGHRVYVCEDAAAVSRAACAEVTGAAAQSFAERGHFALAVAEGDCVDVLQGLEKGPENWDKATLGFVTQKCSGGSASYEETGVVRAANTFATRMGFGHILAPSGHQNPKDDARLYRSGDGTVVGVGVWGQDWVRGMLQLPEPSPGVMAPFTPRTAPSGVRGPSA